MKKYFVPNSTNVSVHRKFKSLTNRLIQHEPEFQEILLETKQNILKIVTDDLSRSEYDVVFFPLSGSGSVESVLSSLTNKILCVSNGEYGRRMYSTSSIYNNKQVKLLEHESEELYSIDYQKIEDTLQNEDFKYLTMVHVEESSGILNDIDKVGKLCAANDTKFIVDACSSIGAIPISMKKMNITALIGTSEKNIEALPGISFIVAKKSYLEALKNTSKTSYLSLKRQYNFQKENNRIRFTIPMYSFVSLYHETQNLLEEGIETRYKRYSDNWEILINKMQKVGLDPVVPEDDQSKLLTSFNAPLENAYDFENLNEFLIDKGFVIYPGKINEMETFRISTIGEIKQYEIVALVNNILEYVQNID
jgi:2-aminoethylphosphonate-pyruvate transaminase